MLYAGELEPLLRPEKNAYEVRTKGDPDALKQPLELAKCVVTKQGTTLEVRLPDGKDARFILEVAVDAGQQVRHLAPLTQTLERAFMKTLEQAGRAAPEG